MHGMTHIFPLFLCLEYEQKKEDEEGEEWREKEAEVCMNVYIWWNEEST